MAKLDEQISTLQDRLSQLKLRQKRIETRRSAIAAQREAKVKTRRRILVGTAVLDMVEDGRIDRNALREWMDAHLVRATDRALFGLQARAGGEGEDG